VFIHDRWEDSLLGLRRWTSIFEMVFDSVEIATDARADSEWLRLPGSYGVFRDEDLDDWPSGRRTTTSTRPTTWRTPSSTSAC